MTPGGAGVSRGPLRSARCGLVTDISMQVATTRMSATRAHETTAASSARSRRTARAKAAGSHGQRDRDAHRSPRPPGSWPRTPSPVDLASDASQTAPEPSRQNALTPNSRPAPAATSPGRRTSDGQSSPAAAATAPGRMPRTRRPRRSDCDRQTLARSTASRSACSLRRAGRRRTARAWTPVCRVAGAVERPRARSPPHPVRHDDQQQQDPGRHRPSTQEPVRPGNRAGHDRHRRRPVEHRPDPAGDDDDHDRDRHQRHDRPGGPAAGASLPQADDQPGQRLAGHRHEGDERQAGDQRQRQQRDRAADVGRQTDEPDELDRPRQVQRREGQGREVLRARGDRVRRQLLRREQLVAATGHQRGDHREHRHRQVRRRRQQRDVEAVLRRRQQPGDDRGQAHQRQGRSQQQEPPPSPTRPHHPPAEGDERPELRVAHDSSDR